jgi:hypothetical protein
VVVVAQKFRHLLQAQADQVAVVQVVLHRQVQRESRELYIRVQAVVARVEITKPHQALVVLV